MSERNVKNANVIINQAIERAQQSGIYALEEVKNIIGALEVMGGFINDVFKVDLPKKPALPDTIKDEPVMIPEKGGEKPEKPAK